MIYDAKIVRWLDGDTLEVTIVLDALGITANRHVRIYGVDAPEKDTPEGQAAKAFIEQKLPPGQNIDLIQRGKDKYGRLLASIGVGLLDARDQLLTNGHGKPYFGGKK